MFWLRNKKINFWFALLSGGLFNLSYSSYFYFDLHLDRFSFDSLRPSQQFFSYVRTGLRRGPFTDHNL